MTLRRFITISLLIIMIGTVSVGANYLYNFDLNSFREEIETIASERISKPISLGKAHFSIKHGPAFAFDSVKIGSPEDNFSLNVEKVFFRLKTLPLLFGEILFSEILLEEPDVAIRIQKEESKPARLLIDERLFTGELVNSLRIHNGTVRITDVRGSGQPEKLVIENIRLSINDLALEQTGRINAKATIVHLGVSSPLTIEGEYSPAKANADWTEAVYRFELNAKHLDAKKLNSWLNAQQAAFSLRGYADLNLQFDGEAQKGVNFAAKLTGEKLDLVTASTETAPTKISEATLGGRIRYDRETATLEGVSFILETGRGRLEIKNQSRLSLTGRMLNSIVSEGQLSARLSTANKSSTPAFFSHNFTAAYKINLSRTKTGWQTTNSEFSLPGIEAKFHGHWNSNDDQYFSLKVDIPDVALTAVTALMPGLSRLNLTGKIDAQLNLDGSATRPLHTVGSLKLSDVHLAIPGPLADLNKLNGSIRINNANLSAKALQAELGNSPISVDLELPDLANPDVTLHVLSDSIRADELIFTSQTRYLKHIDGIVRLADSTVFLGPIYVKMDGGTDATVNGTVKNFAAVEVYLDIQGRHGNIDEIIGLWENTHPKPVTVRPTSKHKVRLTIDIDTESGQISGMPFDRATSQIVLRDDAIVIGPIRFRLEDGEGIGQVLLIKQQDGSSLLKISGTAKNVAAQTVYHQLLKRRGLVSGRLSGDFYLEGIAGKQFLPTSLGAFSMQIDDGRLYKLTGLAKVLHILNLYPLLTENVKGKGLPYKTITFNADLNRGILATEDFLLHGDIMNLSMAGNYDLINSTVNFDMAAMPLRTVDSLISHIPIAGWLLTGKQKALVVAHFNMTGSADDPDIESVPLESVTTPVLGILKRVFTFPVKIITDPEEVLINK